MSLGGGLDQIGGTGREQREWQWRVRCGEGQRERDEKQTTKKDHSLARSDPPTRVRIPVDEVRLLGERQVDLAVGVGHAAGDWIQSKYRGR